MTVSQAIAAADALRPNAFSQGQKLNWLNEAEGEVQINVLLREPEAVVIYALPDDADTALIAPLPHDKQYVDYLIAQIDFHNGDYEKYANDAALYNEQFGAFMRWYAQKYRPAERRHFGITEATAE